MHTLTHIFTQAKSSKYTHRHPHVHVYTHACQGLHIQTHVYTHTHKLFTPGTHQLDGGVPRKQVVQVNSVQFSETTSVFLSDTSSPGWKLPQGTYLVHFMKTKATVTFQQ